MLALFRFELDFEVLFVLQNNIQLELKSEILRTYPFINMKMAGDQMHMEGQGAEQIHP